MEVRRIRIEQLIPAPYNPRKPLKPGSVGWKKLERSLSEFELVQPIVWNQRTGHIVGGHQRVEILRHRGEQEVEAVLVDLPLEREKALNIALNNANVGSTWDIDRLGTLLQELSSLPQIDLTLTGFDERDLRDLLLQPATMEEETPDSEESLVRVVLLVEPKQWESVRGLLDEIVSEYELNIHIQLPSSEGKKQQIPVHNT